MSIIKIFKDQSSIVVESENKFYFFENLKKDCSCPEQAILAFDSIFWKEPLFSRFISKSCDRACLSNARIISDHNATHVLTLDIENSVNQVRCTFLNKHCRIAFTYIKAHCISCMRKLSYNLNLEAFCPFAVFDLTCLVLSNSLDRVYTCLTGKPLTGKEIISSSYIRYWNLYDGTTIACLKPFEEKRRDLPFSLWIPESQFQSFFQNRKILHRDSDFVFFDKETQTQFLTYTLKLSCKWNYFAEAFKNS